MFWRKKPSAPRIRLDLPGLEEDAWSAFEEELRAMLLQIGADKTLTESIVSKLRGLYEKIAERTPIDCSPGELARVVEQIWERWARARAALFIEIAARELALSRPSRE